MPGGVATTEQAEAVCEFLAADAALKAAQARERAARSRVDALFPRTAVAVVVGGRVVVLGYPFNQREYPVLVVPHAPESP